MKATRAKELADPGRLSDPQAELAVLHAETLRIFDIARNSNDHELAFKAIQQTRLNIQLAARMLGVLEPADDAAKNATLSLQTILRILETHRLGKQEATT